MTQDGLQKLWERLESQPPMPPFSSREAAHDPTEASGTDDAGAASVAVSRIGDFFVESGRLSTADIRRITQKQRDDKLRFGDAAVALGLLDAAEVSRALAQQYQYPTATADTVLAAYPVAHAPHSPEAEAIRKLRTQITMSLEGRRARSIAVVSARPGEGKSYVAASLALAFAQTGQRTLLVNADLREAQRSGLLDDRRALGLSSVLAGRHTLDQCVDAPGFSRLSVLDAGPLPPNPTELLLAPSLQKVLQFATRQFGIIIVDTPAASHYPDTQLIARQVDACLIVARQHQTLLRDIQKTRQLIRGAGGWLIGSVYNAYAGPGAMGSSASAPSPGGWRRCLPGRHR